MLDDPSANNNFLQGLSAFQKAKRRAFWQDIISHFNGRPTELLSFDEIKTRLRLRDEYYQGLQEVPLERIVGSVGRYRDFTSTFLPKSNEMQERWSRIYAHQTGAEGLPPIELYKVDDVYFVRDGNHRVSVARQLGATTIEAYVTELPTKVDLEPGMTAEELDAAAAYAMFLEDTGLGRTRPHHEPIKLSEPSRYHELRGHIYVHSCFLERERGGPVNSEEAAAHWYDNVYRPAVTLIRKYEILDHMPKRTEADLYLWLVDHLREVRAQYGDESRTRRMSDAIVDFLAERKIPVPKELLIENDPDVMVTKTQTMKPVAPYANGHALDDTE